ncbi:MAG: EF-hand domain-containing protein [Asticcacaulis sp.]|nr:EF-hand domain-containing protein [Asticcacaulis sp.]
MKNKLISYGLIAIAGTVLVAAAALAAEPGGGRPWGPPPLHRDFSALDANKDGQLDRKEFEAPPPDPFDAMDANHDGKVSQAEFDAFKPDVVFMRLDGPPPPGAPGRGFGMHMQPETRSLDGNGDGKVSFDEFAKPMKDHFDRLDANHDGVLSDDELRADLPPPPPPPGA